MNVTINSKAVPWGQVDFLANARDWMCDRRGGPGISPPGLGETIRVR
jgi:hypothetical protein